MTGTLIKERALALSARSTKLAWGLATLALVLIFVAIVVSRATHTGVGLDQVALFVTIVLVFAVLGGLVASRHPRNAIGWLFLGVAVTEGIAWVISTYADHWVQTGIGPAQVGRAAVWYSQPLVDAPGAHSVHLPAPAVPRRAAAVATLATGCLVRRSRHGPAFSWRWVLNPAT